jgi:MFS family permease
MNIGIFLGIGLGGVIAAAEGWRAALLWLGLPGLALAVLARLTLAEPRAEGHVVRLAEDHESIVQSTERLRKKPSFVFALAAVSVYCIFAYGSSTFMPSFMIRTLHASLRQASAVWGAVILCANVIGSVAGGWIGDRLSQRDLRWYGWLPAITCTAGAALYWMAFSAPNFWSFVSIEFFAESVLGVGFPAMYAGVHIVCGSRRRALAVGIFFLSMVLCGNSVGPFLVGVLSDALAASQGEASLRYSLIALVFIVVPAAALFWAGGQAIPKDLED